MKVVLMVPTYNERDNITPLVERIRKISSDWHILFVDDFSPDGTAGFVRRLQVTDKKIHLVIRKGCRGRGRAGILGFRRALELGADRIVEMDADLSHDPGVISQLLETSMQPDSQLVIASRYMKGGHDEDRVWIRRFISLLGRYYIRLMFWTGIKDPTSGFRCFRREVFDIVKLSTLTADDPFIVAETLFWCLRKGVKIKEIPISFHRRVCGVSKLTPATLMRYLVKVMALRLKTIVSFPDPSAGSG